MREPSYFTHEAYQLTKVALERSDVPAEALALLSTWIEGEGLLVDDREDVGGINFCRMDAKVMAPSLQAQSWALPQVERLLSAPLPGCG